MTMSDYRLGVLADLYAKHGGLNDSLPVTANPQMMAQSAKVRQTTPRKQQSLVDLMNIAAIGLSPVPVIGDALGLGADAYRYATDPTSRTPLNFGLTALGALPFIPPASAIFGGVLAKTANLDKKTLAEGMEKVGRSRDDIWKETGWFKGDDGKWRFEIGDESAKFRATFDAAHSLSGNKPWGGTEGPIGGMLSHDALYKAYPELLRNERVLLHKSTAGMPDSSNRASRTTYLNKPNEIYVRDKTESGALSALMHEIQHAIQQKEKFALGGNEFSAGGFDAYRKLPGEVEARAVQSRLTMTPAQRQQIPPWVSMDKLDR